MKLSHTLLTASAVALMVTLVACSSDDDASSSGNASSCAAAKKVSDDCNAQPSEGGVSVTADFDQAKCESGGDAAKKVADCITANKSNCACVLKCAITGGTCS
ncbi:MAG: hypothetical protein JWP97_4040 [Labilithrix sp.]|nr:hypothetical protein [Labilithrix sp.]